MTGPTPRTGTRVVIFGGGGFARETLDVIDAHNAARPYAQIAVDGVVDGSLDDFSRRALERRPVALLGSDEEWLRSSDKAVHYLIAVGDPAIKRRIDERLRANGFSAHVGVVHPEAGLGSGSVIGDGSIVCAGVQVSTGVTIGRHVHLNPNSTIGHDATIADLVSINPAAVISGHDVVHEGVLVGAGAVVLERRTIGSWSTVGAAACVVRDVTPGATVKGVPAR